MYELLVMLNVKSPSFTPTPVLLTCFGSTYEVLTMLEINSLSLSLSHVRWTWSHLYSIIVIIIFIWFIPQIRIKDLHLWRRKPNFTHIICSLSFFYWRFSLGLPNKELLACHVIYSYSGKLSFDVQVQNKNLTHVILKTNSKYELAKINLCVEHSGSTFVNYREPLFVT